MEESGEKKKLEIRGKSQILFGSRSQQKMERWAGGHWWREWNQGWMDKRPAWVLRALPSLCTAWCSITLLKWSLGTTFHEANFIKGCDAGKVEHTQRGIKCRSVGESSLEGHTHSTLLPACWDFRKTNDFVYFPIVLKFFFFFFYSSNSLPKTGQTQDTPKFSIVQ